MKNKLFIVFLIGCPALFGQDTVISTNQTTVGNIVDRFNQITGSEINYEDSLKSLLVKIDELMILNKELNDQNKAVSDALQDFKQSLYLSDRNFLIEKYGKNYSGTEYSPEQYTDFKNNYFLKHYLSEEKGILVFFPYNKSVANLTIYAEIDRLVEQYSNQNGLTFRIKAYSDSHGSEKTNMKLSKDRAEFIRNYLIKEKKVNPQNIKIEGKGSKSEERFTEAELDFMNRRASIILN